MTGVEEEEKKGESKGFAGLSSLVSVVDTPPPPVAKMEPAASAPSSEFPAPQTAQPPPSQQNQTFQETAQPPSSGWSGGKWVLGIATMIGIILLIGQTNKSPPSPASAYSPSAQPQQSAMPSFSPPAEPQVTSSPALYNSRVQEMRDSITTVLTASSGDVYIPQFSSEESRVEYERLQNKARQHLTAIESIENRGEFIQTVWYESVRAGLDPNLVLGLIQVVSGYRKFAVSDLGARGYMQVAPIWSKKIGDGDSGKLFHTQTNLRFGCVLLRHFVDSENGDIQAALRTYHEQADGQFSNLPRSSAAVFAQMVQEARSNWITKVTVDDEVFKRSAAQVPRGDSQPVQASGQSQHAGVAEQKEVLSTAQLESVASIPLETSKLGEETTAPKSAPGEQNVFEQATIESACGYLKRARGPADYYQCQQEALSKLSNSGGQPDLSRISASEQASIESACGYLKRARGPADYYQCQQEALTKLSNSGGQPDLSRISASEQASIESACGYLKRARGPADYYQCQQEALTKLSNSGGQPDLSRISASEKASIESACGYLRRVKGPADYYQCMRRELNKLP